MKSTHLFQRTALALAKTVFLSAIVCVSAGAQQYPAKPITVVTAFGAGSSTDISTRSIAQRLSTALGQPVVVVNKPGATGKIAALAVTSAPPDGYTLLATTNSVVAAPYLIKDPGYDPAKDLTAISLTGYVPAILVINPEVPANSVTELTAIAKAKPGKLSYAGGASLPQIAGATYASRAHIDLMYVPYGSTPQALQDLLAGRVSMMFLDIQTSTPHIRAGKLRALAVTPKNRSQLWPEMATMQEAGVPNFDINSWQAWFGPANMPEEIVTRLATEMRKILESPEIKAQFAQRGMEAVATTPKDFAAFIGSEVAHWAKLTKDAGIQPQ